MKYLFISEKKNAADDIAALKAAFAHGDALIVNAEDEIILPEGLGRVYSAAAENMEIFVEAAETLILKNKYDRICFAGGRLQNSAASMLAARLGLDIYPDIREIESAGESLTVRRRVYGGNIEAQFIVNGPAVLSLAPAKSKNQAVSEKYRPFKLDNNAAPPWLISSKFIPRQEENTLKNAKILFAAGKGIGSRENYMRLKAAALKLGAYVGATRAVILSGWAPLEDMIGQSGSICAPKICVCFGASGAAPFLAGVEQAEKLIAINTDPSAAIFSAADTGITADCREVLQELEKLTLN